MVHALGTSSVLVQADAADGVALAVVGAAEVLVAAVEVASDGGEILAGVAHTRGAVGDVGSLLESEAAAVVFGKVHQGGEVVEVGRRGDLVGVTAQAAEVAQGDVADGVILRDSARIVARAGHGEGGSANTAAARVGDGVVGASSERPSARGDGGHRLDGATTVNVVSGNAADGGVAARQGRVRHIVEDDLPEGLARGDGDGDRVLVAAHRDGASRDGAAAAGLDRGAVKPQRGAIEGHRERATGDNVGVSGGFLEVERAVDGAVNRIPVG